MVFTVFLSSRISPRTSTVIFFDRSPLATAVATCAMFRTWLVRLLAMCFTLPVRSFHGPADTLYFGLAAELAFRADFARHARDLGGEGVELVHHDVDRVFELENFPARFHGNFLREVAVGHGGRDLCDIPNLVR